MSVISILTDFGTDDEYVGVMKGVMLSINPSVSIVDISHRIAPQDVVQAAYLIPAYYHFFPQKTVHIVVVDPGVGSRRSILAVSCKRHFFIAPDNGVLTLLLNAEKSDTIIRVDNSDFFLQPLSSTFHGRDIFAAVGGHLSRGAKLEALGARTGVKEIVRLKDLNCRLSQTGELTGKVVSIDRFGNLMTNIDSVSLAAFCKRNASKKLQIHIGAVAIAGLSRAYSDAAPKSLLAYVGSRNYLEIAVNSGNAKEHLNARKGDPVRLTSF